MSRGGIYRPGAGGTVWQTGRSVLAREPTEGPPALSQGRALASCTMCSCVARGLARPQVSPASGLHVTDALHSMSLEVSLAAAAHSRRKPTGVFSSPHFSPAAAVPAAGPVL